MGFSFLATITCRLPSHPARRTTGVLNIRMEVSGTMGFASLFASLAFEEEEFGCSALPQTEMPSHTVQEAKAYSFVDSN
jgi:hypothetical protein